MVYVGVTKKLPEAFPTRVVRFSLHGEVALYPISLQGGDNPQSLTLFLDQGQVKHTLSSTGWIMDMGQLPPLYLVGTSS